MFVVPKTLDEMAFAIERGAFLEQIFSRAKLVREAALEQATDALTYAAIGEMLWEDVAGLVAALVEARTLPEFEVLLETYKVVRDAEEAA